MNMNMNMSKAAADPSHNCAPSPQVVISEAAEVGVLQPAIRAFCNPESEVDAYGFAISREQILAGNAHAFFVPAVRFVVAAGLDALRLPEAQAQLPLEIAERAVEAHKVVKRLTRLGIELGIFELGYRTRGMYAPDLKEALQYAHHLYDLEYMPRLAMAPFSDVANVGGGAVRLLQEDRPATADRTEVVKRSLGLTTVAKVDLNLTSLLYAWLGNPYANIRHLKIDDDRLGPKVRFTPESRQWIEANYHAAGGVCPLAKMKSPRSRGSILQEDWRAIVNYLIPPNATVDRYRVAEADQSLILS